MDCNNYTTIFAPTFYEAKPLISYLKAYEEFDHGFCKFYFSHELKLVIVMSGVGAKRITRAYERLRACGKPKKIILTGIAGGISRTAELGEFVFVNKIQRYSAGGKEEFVEVSKAYELKYENESTNIINVLDDNLKADYKRGAMVTVDRFFGSREAKKRLNELSGAVLVDMEGYDLCGLVMKDGIRFECYKIISDTLNENFNINFSSFCDLYGRTNLKDLLMYIFRNPFKLYAICKFAANLRKIRPRIFDLARFVKEAS